MVVLGSSSMNSTMRVLVSFEVVLRPLLKLLDQLVGALVIFTQDDVGLYAGQPLDVDSYRCHFHYRLVIAQSVLYFHR